MALDTPVHEYGPHGFDGPLFVGFARLPSALALRPAFGCGVYLKITVQGLNHALQLGD